VTGALVHEATEPGFESWAVVSNLLRVRSVFVASESVQMHE